MPHSTSRRVRAVQNISRDCLVCGADNPHGLHARFYELAAQDDAGPEVLGLFTPGEEHQSYPGRLHGGIAAAVLDETIGRAILLHHPDQWGVTAELTVRYRRPLPLDGELRCVARITRDASRLFEGAGEIVLADGTVAAEARGKYVKLPIADITQDFDGSQWLADPREAPADVEL